MKILFLMMLFHVIDDFVFQPICLSKLKQKSWWEKNILKEDINKYKYDYKAALTMHSLSWAIMITLPWWFLSVSEIAIGLSVLINMIIHYHIDDLKANERKINLQTDQNIHLIQITITWLILSIL